MAAELISRLRELESLYARLASYTDSGTVTTVFAGHLPPTRPDAHFTTQFHRAGAFDFRYNRRASPASADDFAAECHIYWQGTKLEAHCVSQFTLHAQLVSTDHFAGDARPETFAQAVDDSGSLTDGTSSLVPRLLLPNATTGRRITDLDEVSDTDLTGDVAGPADCHLVSGTQGESIVTLWISAESGLIRRAVRMPASREHLTRLDYARATRGPALDS